MNYFIPMIGLFLIVLSSCKKEQIEPTPSSPTFKKVKKNYVSLTREHFLFEYDQTSRLTNILILEGAFPFDSTEHSFYYDEKSNLIGFDSKYQNMWDTTFIHSTVRQYRDSVILTNIENTTYYYLNPSKSINRLYQVENNKVYETYYAYAKSNLIEFTWLENGSIYSSAVSSFDNKPNPLVFNTEILPVIDYLFFGNGYLNSFINSVNNPVSTSYQNSSSLKITYNYSNNQPTYAFITQLTASGVTIEYWIKYEYY